MRDVGIWSLPRHNVAHFSFAGYRDVVICTFYDLGLAAQTPVQGEEGGGQTSQYISRQQEPLF